MYMQLLNNNYQVMLGRLLPNDYYSNFCSTSQEILENFEEHKITFEILNFLSKFFFDILLILTKLVHCFD